MRRRDPYTEAARKFSELLNSVKYKGDHYTLVRGGKPVASIGPVEAPLKARTLGELKDLLRQLPRLGDEAARLERDLRDLLRHQPSMRRKSRWA